MFNSERTYDFGRPDSNFALVILDAPEHLQEVKNKLWLKFDLLEYTHNPTTSPLINWVGYIDLDDMSFKNDSSFIKFPIHENFPVKGYTMNTIINKFGSALYITGGEVYSKKDNSYTASNSFYKYNFTTKEWIDMTYSANKNLKPLFDHKSVVINNRYLVILGGKRRIIYNSIPREYDSDHPEFEHNSLYNLTIFDTYSNIWENFNIIPDIFDTHIATLQFLSLIATVHKDKIIVLSGLSGENRSNIFTSYEYSGIFDFKSKTWAWFPILNEDGSKYHRFLDGISVKIPNDQIIIFDGFFGYSYLPIQVYDILAKRIKPTLRILNSLKVVNSIKEKNKAQNQSKTLPIYAIVLIALSYAILLGAFLYIACRKIKKKQAPKNGKIKYNGPIREVWANPDIYNTNNIITFDKNNSSNALYSNYLFKNSDNQM